MPIAQIIPLHHKQGWCKRHIYERRAILGTSPPRAMSQIVLRLWCITGGLTKPLSVRIGTQWVWRGLSTTLCGMPHVPVQNAEHSWLDRGQSAQLAQVAT